MKAISLFLFTLFQYIYCNEFDIPGVRHIYMLSQIQDEIEQSEITYFIYYYHPDSENSKKGVKLIKDMIPKLKFIADVIFINCPESDMSELSVCIKPEGVKDGFPRMVVLVPPKLKTNPYTKKPNKYAEKKYIEKEVTPKSIYKFITDFVNDYSTNLNNDNLDEFLNNVDHNKLILFTDKEQTPLLFRGLSGYYYDRVKFGIVKKDKKDIINRFRVMEFPTLLMYNVVEDGIALFEPVIDLYNGEIKAHAIAKSLDYIALSKKKYIIDKMVQDGVSQEKENYGIKKITVEIIDYYFQRHLNRNFFAIFRKGKPLDKGIVEFAKKVAGFTAIMDFDCSDEEIDKKLKEKLKFNCEDYKTYWYIADLERPGERAIQMEDLFKLFTEVPDISIKGLHKMFKKLFPSKLVEITSEDYNYTRLKAINQGKIPFIYLYDNVKFLILEYI